jgi:hypothetical protein
MKKMMMAALMGLACVVANGQEYGCATDEQTAILFNAHPAYQASFEAQQDRLAELEANASNRAENKHIIPVVVHVLYNTCSGNISMAQIQDGLRIVNEDFNRKNADSVDTRSYYLDVAANSEIEFRLARIDPDGDPTTGVVRMETSAAVDAQNNVKPLSYWPSDEYLNIWIVESIYNFTSGGGTILGYAQFPGSGPWNTYGLVVRNDAFGTIGTSNSDGRTVTHELGHCLNLYHTFQDGCGNYCTNSGDYVCDTPPVSVVTYDCGTAHNTCGNDANGSNAYSSNVPDMIENYMSYNSCQNLFTEGQKSRMTSALNGINTLEDLTSESNLIATGVVGLVYADFTTTNPIICQGEATSFADASLYTGEPQAWTFSGEAIPSSSTDVNPSVVFPYSGLQEVSYTIADGSDTMIVTKDVFVLDQEGQYAPFTDDMESFNSLPSNQWFPVNVDGDEYKWKVSNEAAYSGSQSLKMDNYGSCGERIDELYLQSFDFSPYSSVNISFKQAFATTPGGNNVYLRMYVSNDCGESWVLNWAKSTSALTSVNGSVSNPFVPADQSEWKNQNITLGNSAHMREGLLLKFEFGGTGGNNFYLDDFEINGTFNGDLLLRLPEDGKQGLATDVLLDWKSAGFVDSYEYQLDKVSDFTSSSLVTGTKAFVSAAPDQSDTEFLAEGLDVGTTYYWRVRYTQSGSTSDWSDTWSFTVSESGVGIIPIASADVKVFPNPSDGLININAQIGIQSLRMMDFTGRVLLSEPIMNQKNTSINAAHLPAGVYLIQIETALGIESKTIVLR